MDSENRAAAANHRDHVVERACIFCPIHTTVTFVDVLTIVNDLFQARNSYSLSFLPMEANHIGGDNRLRLLTAHKCSVSKNE